MRSTWHLSNAGHLPLGDLTVKMSHPGFFVVLNPASSASASSSNRVPGGLSLDDGANSGNECLEFDWNNGFLHLPGVVSRSTQTFRPLTFVSLLAHSSSLVSR